MGAPGDNEEPRDLRALYAPRIVLYGDEVATGGLAAGRSQKEVL